MARELIEEEKIIFPFFPSPVRNGEVVNGAWKRAKEWRKRIMKLSRRKWGNEDREMARGNGKKMKRLRLKKIERAGRKEDGGKNEN